jgi:hypothetical protein
MFPTAEPPETQAPPAPVSRREAAIEMHRRLETLEDAAGFAAATRAMIDRLADRLLEMQRLAERVADAPGEVEDREVAYAKINLLAHQAGALAEKPVYQDVPVLRGGAFRFELAGDPDPLEVEIANLRAQGEGSLGLFEHVDAMFLMVGAGGPVLAGQGVPLPDREVEAAPPRALPEGTYRVQVTYEAIDASLVRLQLLSLEGEILAEREGLDLSADGDGVEVDLENGLALILDRVARAAEMDIGTTTSQVVEWRHESGERLASAEGWFHETVQPRDFELYALFLEGPIETVTAARAAIEAFEARLEARLEALLEGFSGGDLEPSGLRLALRPGAPAWDAIDSEALKDALAEEV